MYLFIYFCILIRPIIKQLEILKEYVNGQDGILRYKPDSVTICERNLSFLLTISLL